MGDKNTAPEGIDDTPYVGADDGFPDMDDMSPEEQAAYEAEMAGELESDADDGAGDDDGEAPAGDQESARDEGGDDDPGNEEGDDDRGDDAGEEDQAELDAANQQEDDPEGDDGEEDPEDPPQQQRDEPRIPKARFDQERRRRQELERRVQEMEARGRVEEAEAAELALDFNDVIDQDAITRALDMNLDGKNSEAAQALIAEMTKAIQHGVTAGRDQMRTEFNSRLEAGMTETVSRVSQQSVEERYNSAVDQVENDYPIFNPESDQFDEGLMDSAATLMKAFRSEGKDPVEALNEAIEVTLLRNKPELLQSRGNESGQEQETAGRARRTADNRARRQREENARSAERQPQRQAGRSAAASDSQIDLESLSEEEFDALPESTKAELRGDAL